MNGDMVNKVLLSDNTICRMGGVGVSRVGGRPLSTFFDTTGTPQPRSYTKLGSNGDAEFVAWLGILSHRPDSQYCSVKVTQFKYTSNSPSSVEVKLSFVGDPVKIKGILRSIRQFEVHDVMFALRLVQLPKTLFGPFRVTTMQNCILKTVNGDTWIIDAKSVAVGVDL